MSECLPDTDNTAPVMLAIGILMMIGGMALLVFVRRLYRRERDQHDHYGGPYG